LFKDSRERHVLLFSISPAMTLLNPKLGVSSAKAAKQILNNLLAGAYGGGCKMNPDTEKN
jgi:hypothetical protein